jgi:hypothetical protein
MTAPECRALYCCGCGAEVQARLTDGREIYPHRPDLAELPFWRCDACGNHVGCHHKTEYRTKPLGNISTPEIRNARRHIHEILDPLWKTGVLNRSQIYRRISAALGRKYHTAEIRSVEEARVIYRIVGDIQRDPSPLPPVPQMPPDPNSNRSKKRALWEKTWRLKKRKVRLSRLHPSGYA